MAILLVIPGVFLLAFIISRFLKEPIDTISDSRHYTFEEMKFSTQEFYTLAIDLVKGKAIPDVKMYRVFHSTKGMFSAKREYLRVVYHEYFFDICAAPFAKDFFVSWRQGTLKQFVTVGKRKTKTFFEEDTELMFKNSIKLCVDRAISLMTEEKGTRLPEVKIVPTVQAANDKSAQLAEDKDWPRVNEEYAADF